MSLGSRINDIRKEKKISIDELCARSGVPKGTLSKITAGITTNPTLDTVQAIAKALECRLDDFDDAPQNAKKEAPSDLTEEALRIAKDYTALSDHGKGAVKAILIYESGTATINEPEPKIQKVVPIPKARRTHSGITEIEVYEQPAAAGLGNYLDEPPHHTEQYPDDVIPPDADFGVIISGDSMEPKIHDGGTVFVQSVPTIDSGRIGIFVLNGQAYCKKLVVDHDSRQIRLVSLNPEYKDIVIQESDNIRTLGRVLGQWTKGYPNDDIFGW